MTDHDRINDEAAARLQAAFAPNIMQVLSDAGINPFGVILVAESLLRSPIAAQIADRAEPLKLFMPIKRSDCEGWDGVEITLMPVRTVGRDASHAGDLVPLKNGRSVDLGGRWNLPK